MDVERALLAKIASGEDIRTLINGRITPDFFRDDAYRRVYTFMLEHWKRYKQTPDVSVMKLSYPSYDWSTTHHSIDWLIESIRDRRTSTILVTALEQSATILASARMRDNPAANDEILDIMRNCVMQVHLETTETSDIDITQYREEMMRTLDDLTLNPGYLRGISSGFRGIDYVTGGWQPEQFIVLMGLPKAMKSSTALYMAIHAHRQAQRPLFIGFEMTNREQIFRLTSVIAGVPLSHVTNGTMNAVEHRKVADAWKVIEEMRSFVISEDISNSITVSGVQGKIMEYMPDVVFIDAAYLMHSEIPKIEQGSAAALTDVARSLKQLAQSVKVPIVATVQATQTRTTGGKLRADSAMYTQAWRQSADVLLGQERTDPDQDDTGEVSVTIKVLASRSGPKAVTDLVWDWSKGAVYDMSTMQTSTASDPGDD